MTVTSNDTSTPRTPLRLWPGVVAVVAQWLAWLVVPSVLPEIHPLVWVGGGAIGALAVVVWWVFFSRAAWSERLGAVALMVVGVAATHRFLDLSVSNAGQGLMFFFFAIPVLSLAFVVGVVASRNLADGSRRATMVVVILLACGAWTLLRIDGITGDSHLELQWRWVNTPEERLLARPSEEPLTAVSAVPGAEADWPGFRGPERDGHVRGVRIRTDWSVVPPVELWRRPIGPGVSSFAVGGGLLYTQEQRGDDEIVSSYSVSTGAPVWRHSNAVRFWDSHAGPGPRGTPTLRNGRVYTFGGTGIVNALDATTGAVVWSRNAASDTDRNVPYWGFSSSPLVVGDMVIVAVAGTLVAYDLDTGDPRWFGPNAGGGYSSPHLLTLDGVAQVVLISGGVISLDPGDGTVLWQHEYSGGSIVQPAVTADGDLLIGDMNDLPHGIRRIAVARGAEGWTTEERWSSTRLKPYFNDFVVHDGHAYGFDGSILACIDVENGERTWKGGRYGHGQLLLLPAQDLLLVVTEQGELALVAAASDQFTEIARFPAIDGKTWNHPVLVGDLLLVRNREEMAAFRLSLAGA